jgi:hypothetical protein
MPKPYKPDATRTRVGASRADQFDQLRQQLIARAADKAKDAVRDTLQAGLLSFIAPATEIAEATGDVVEAFLDEKLRGLDSDIAPTEGDNPEDYE